MDSIGREIIVNEIIAQTIFSSPYHSYYFHGNTQLDCRKFFVGRVLDCNFCFSIRLTRYQRSHQSHFYYLCQINHISNSKTQTSDASLESNKLIST